MMSLILFEVMERGFTSSTVKTEEEERIYRGKGMLTLLTRD